jgi:thiopeptide-type bacteriocin biosynthesis protein
MASDVWPRLRAAKTDGTITAWWYIRKTPHWRLRLHPGQAGTAALAPFIHAVLHDLTCYGLIRRWRPGIYEPETLTFGGRAGIAAAHRLFHADSTHILDHLNHTDTADSPLGRRELSLLLCTALLRAAGQDWHEHGDVWHRVACMRPLPPGASTDRLYRIADHVRLLLSLDTTAPTPRSALVPARPWLAAFTEAGRTLGAAAHTGTLRRGLRDVLAHHIIFHWNRLGLPTTTQAVLAHAAVTATLNPSPPRNPTSDVATT